jgi:enoyl-CoA hydratase
MAGVTTAPDAEAHPLLTERRGPEGDVLVVTINRPHARNAITRAVSDGIAAAMDELDGNPQIRAAILTGAEWTFCAGMDLKAFVRGEDPYVPGRGFAGLAFAPPKKPLIAAVEGWALAGGCEIVLSCDLVVAAESAKFGIPEVKRGLSAAAGGLFRLPLRIPYHVAMELVLTGDPVEAPRAYELGLVNKLTPTGGALDAALEFAAKIAANGPMAVIASKDVVRHAHGWSDEEAQRAQESIVRPVLRSADAKEGARAFAEKRAPVWRGR